MTSDAPAETAAPDPGAVSYAILDQAAWSRFAGADSVEAFVGAWLALLCRGLSGARAAVVVLGDPDTGPFVPAGAWPVEEAADAPLMDVAEQALGRRQPVMRQAEQAFVGLPLLLDGHLYGAVAVRLSPDGLPPGKAVRHLRWGAGWIEVLLRRDLARSQEALQTRTAAALAMLATVLEQREFGAAANALVIELARSLDCDPVSLGMRRGRRLRVVALSHAAGFGRRTSVLRDIRAAMHEAIDQQAVILWPAAPDWDYRVTLAHQELVDTHKAKSALTVPIQHDGEIIGALTLERAREPGFDAAAVELVDAIATMVGPVLEEKRRNDRLLVVKIADALAVQATRLLGPRYFGRKLATLAFIALVWALSTATTTFSVTAPAELQGTIQRTVVSPFNGYLAAESVQAGDLVEAGQVLARLDDQDLRLERLRQVTSRSQRQAEYDQALAGHDRAGANIIETQIRQIDSQIALVDEQIARTRIRAPFTGMVVSGDLSQSIGATVERGQELFRIAPLDGYRVILEVDETDLAAIEPGQEGTLRVAPLPDLPLPYRIDRIRPVSDQKDGRNFFRVDARLLSEDPRLRPSMKGVTRTDIDRRLLVEVWTRPFLDWLRMAVWRWEP